MSEERAPHWALLDRETQALIRQAEADLAEIRRICTEIKRLCLPSDRRPE